MAGVGVGKHARRDVCRARARRARGRDERQAAQLCDLGRGGGVGRPTMVGSGIRGLDGDDAVGLASTTAITITAATITSMRVMPRLPIPTGPSLRTAERRTHGRRHRQT